LTYKTGSIFLSAGSLTNLDLGGLRIANSGGGAFSESSLWKDNHHANLFSLTIGFFSSQVWLAFEPVARIRASKDHMRSESDITTLFMRQFYLALHLRNAGSSGASILN
jgi:hypothetical protein